MERGPEGEAKARQRLRPAGATRQPWPRSQVWNPPHRLSCRALAQPCVTSA